MRFFSLFLLSALLATSVATPARAGVDLPPCPLDPVVPVDPNAPVPPPPPPRPVLSDEPTMPAPAPGKSVSPDYFQKASLWKNIPGSASWTNAVLGVVRSRMHDFEQARDVETFCPGYSRATQAQREICWLRLTGAIVEFESSFKPKERPFCEGNGVYSVGLLALSTGECDNAMTVEDLQDPVKSLTCGLNRMAKLINRDHYISSDDNSGACAYWSTLRGPHVVKLPSGRMATLGKRDEIVQRTKTFNRY